MKFINKLLLMSAIAVVATPLIMFAQDSTGVLKGADAGFVNSLVTYFEGKWPVITTIGSLLFLLSEILGSIPSIKANAVYQLLFGILKDLFGKKTILPILGITIGIGIVLTSCHHGGIPQIPVENQNDTTQKEISCTRDTLIVIDGSSLDTSVSIAYLDSLSIVHLPSESDTLIAYNFKKGNLTNKLSLSNGKLHFTCTADSLQRRIDWLTSHWTVLTIRNTRTITVTNFQTTYKTPHWVWYLVGFILIYFGLKFMALLITPSSSVTSLLFGLIKQAP